jgi:hypothetical protein
MAQGRADCALVVRGKAAESFSLLRPNAHLRKFLTAMLRAHCLEFREG